MKKLISIATVFCLFANALIAQPKPAQVVQKVGNVEIIDSANDFPNKGLPKPKIFGRDISDELAVDLAKEISAYDEDSLSVLMTALQKAGFYIQDENLKTLYSPMSTNDIGLAFYDFEVAGMYQTSQSGGTTTIAKITEILASKVPGASADIAAKALLFDIRNGAKSKNASYRFFSRLIIELGKQMPVPIDLNTVTPDKAIVNVIQASLIERYLIAELLYQYEVFSRVAGVAQYQNPFKTKIEFPMFVNASFKPMADDCGEVSQLENLIKQIENGKKIMDKGAKGATMFANLVSKLMGGKGAIDLVTPSDAISQGAEAVAKEFIGEKGFEKATELLKNIKAGVEVLNAALGFVKWAQANRRIEAEIKVEDPLPLIRTKSNREPGGAVRTVTAKFKMKMPEAKKVNCYAKALNLATGISFDLPEDGLMKGVPVSWELVTGAGYQNILNTPVYLDAVEKRLTSNLSTDDNGESKVKLTGKPQRENIENQLLAPKEKLVFLRVSIAQEAMNLKSDGKGLIGMIPAFVAGISGVGVVAVVPTVMSKMKLKSFGVMVPVRDWQPVSKDWGGIINVRVTKKTSKVIKGTKASNGNSSGDGFSRYELDYNVSATLNPRTNEEILANAPLKKANIVVNGKEEEITETKVEDNPCCEKVEGKFNDKRTQGYEARFNHAEDGRVSVKSGVHGLKQLSLPSMSFPVKRRTYLQSDSDCASLIEESYDKKEEAYFGIPDIGLPDGNYREPPVYLADMELLSGEKRIYYPDGTEYYLTWRLARQR